MTGLLPGSPRLVNEVRALADLDLGDRPWIAAIVEAVHHAHDDDLGTLAVARALLTEAANIRRGEIERRLATEKREQEEARSRVRQRIREREEAVHEAELALGERMTRLAKAARRRWRVCSVVSALLLTAYAVWVLGLSGEFMPGPLAAGVLFMVLTLVSTNTAVQSVSDSVRKAERDVDHAHQQLRDAVRFDEADSRRKATTVPQSTAPRTWGQPTHNARRNRRLLVIAGVLAFVTLSTVSALRTSASGDSFACAIAPDGAVKCWGNNSHGQLGDGTTTDRPIAVTVLGLDRGARSLSTGRGIL